MAPTKLIDRAGRVLVVGSEVRVMSDPRQVLRHCNHCSSLKWHAWMEPLCGQLGKVTQVDKADQTIAVEFNEQSAQDVLAENLRGNRCWLPVQVLESPDDGFDDGAAAVAYVLDMNERLLEDDKFHDVTFKLDGGEACAHRSVLAAASPAFAGMFAVPMREKTSGVVDLQDVKVTPFRVFLRMLYTGHVDAKDWTDVWTKTTEDPDVMSLELLIDVAKLAKRYLIPTVASFAIEALKRRMEDATENAVIIETVLSAAILADLGSVRVAAIEIAKSSKSLRRKYDESDLLPEVAAELQGIWPPAKQAKQTSKRVRLK